MLVIRCPNCGRQCADAEIRGPGAPGLLCPECGKRIESPGAENCIPSTSLKSPSSAGNRWSEGPPEESANRWSAVAPLGDDSFSSESLSVSQISILPDGVEGRLHEAVVVPPRRWPLTWTLIVAALILAALIGAFILTR